MKFLTILCGIFEACFVVIVAALVVCFVIPGALGPLWTEGLSADLAWLRVLMLIGWVFVGGRIVQTLVSLCRWPPDSGVPRASGDEPA